jgi:hypothetical protein
VTKSNAAADWITSLTALEGKCPLLVVFGQVFRHGPEEEGRQGEERRCAASTPASRAPPGPAR